MLATALATALACQLAAQDVRFDTASLKRNTTTGNVSVEPLGPNGEVRLINVSMRTLVAFAFPLDANAPIVGLPPWADSERYDLAATGKPDASIEERQQMVRALLAQRAKLEAHFEMQEQESYSLVLARDDGQLGPGLAPSTLDCSTPPSNTPAAGGPVPTDLKTQVMNRCNVMFTDPFDETSYAGGAKIELLVRTLTMTLGRPVVDRTGLAGFFAMKVRFARSPDRTSGAPSADASPPVFTALPEQLGLKLEPDHTPVQVLVIDRLERPDEN